MDHYFSWAMKANRQAKPIVVLALLASLLLRVPQLYGESEVPSADRRHLGMAVVKASVTSVDPIPKYKKVKLASLQISRVFFQTGGIVEDAARCTIHTGSFGGGGPDGSWGAFSDPELRIGEEGIFVVVKGALPPYLLHAYWPGVYGRGWPVIKGRAIEFGEVEEWAETLATNPERGLDFDGETWPAPPPRVEEAQVDTSDGVLPPHGGDDDPLDLTSEHQSEPALRFEAKSEGTCWVVIGCSAFAVLGAATFYYLGIVRRRRKTG